MIVQLVATNRPGSNTAKVAAHVAEIYAAKGTPLHIVDLHQLPPEIFSPSSYAEKPASFAPFQEAILKASGIVIVTPEYNGGIPGVFKYFLDMLKFPGRSPASHSRLWASRRVWAARCVRSSTSQRW